MPRLEQKVNGDYYILAYSHSKGGIDTWQVRDCGLKYLNGKGYYAGNMFPANLLEDLKKSNCVFIGGPAIHSGNANYQTRSSMPTSVAAKSASSMKKALLVSRKSIPQRSKVTMRTSSNIIRKTISLVFRKYKKRWELLIVFPKLHIDASKSHLLNGYRLTVVGATNILKANQLKSIYGEASIPVRPQVKNYELKLVGSDASCNDLLPLLDESGISLCDVKGLKVLGTIFKKNREVLPLNEGLRLDEHEPLILGESYFMIFNTDCEPEWIPRTLEVKNLGDEGRWEAWEIKLPPKTDITLSNWCIYIGHAL